MSPIESDDQWQVAAPDSVGIDGAKLCALVPTFEESKEANLHGVVVVRHGKLAFEHYFRGYDLKAPNGPATIDFDRTTGHDLRSATKSITALVLGAAIDRGMITDVNESVLSFFPDYADLRTPEKDQITIRDLLTMSMGLDWNDDAPYTNENTMNASIEPYRYVLSLGVVQPAGRVWNYSGGATALIGAFLVARPASASMSSPRHSSSTRWASPMSRGHAFETATPRTGAACGSGRATWRKSANSVLNRGQWNGARVVSESWITAATAPQIKTIYSGYYGYQFWLGASSVSGRRIDWVAAQGQGGQRIFVVPSLDVVAVVTAGNYYGNDRLASLVPQTVLDEYVLPSVDPAR